MSWKDQESAASIRLRSIFLPLSIQYRASLGSPMRADFWEGEGDKRTALYIFFASRPCLPSHVIFFERAGRALQLGSSVKGFGAEGKIKLTNLWMRIGGRRGRLDNWLHSSRMFSTASCGGDGTRLRQCQSKREEPFIEGGVATSSALGASCWFHHPSRGFSPHPSW